MAHVNQFGHPVPPPRRVFFAALAELFPPEEVVRIGQAYDLSKAGHAKMERDAGERFFDHPKMAAWILVTECGIRDANTLIVALLHSLREDQSYLLRADFLRLVFPADIVADVAALTKRPRDGQRVVARMERVSQRGARAIVVMLANRLHNLRTLSACPPKKQERFIAETHAHYFGLIECLNQLLASPGQEEHPLVRSFRQSYQLALMEAGRHCR